MSGPAQVSRLWLECGGRRFSVQAAQGVSLAIPLALDGRQPAHFGAPAARAEPLSASGFTGDTRAGGSCNCAIVTLVPHCNGTHTEGPGHVTRERVSVHGSALQALYLTALISVAPEGPGDCGESSDPAPQPGDRLITARALAAALDDIGAGTLDAVAVRTLPNSSEKLERDWMQSPLPPYFSREAMALMVERGVLHLLSDLPSVDRLLDDGRLTGHRVFFGLPARSDPAAAIGRPAATITEMIYAPDSLPDGLYALSLQLASWVSDAVPSRPVLFPLVPA